MLQRVDHIDLRVTNVEEAIAFFKQLGFVEVRRTEPPRLSVEVALPGPDQVVFEVRPAGEGGKTGINHIALRQAGPDARTKLEALGIEFQGSGTFVQGTGRTVNNFRDADGNRWQLTD